MPTLTIEGRKVQVDEGFLKLTPEEQEETVEEIAASLGVKPGQGAASDGEQHSTFESAIAGAAQGATLGFADEMKAGVRGAVDYARGKVGLGPETTLGDAYSRNLDHWRGELDEMRSEDPIAAYGGEIAGSVVLPGASLKAGAGLGVNALRLGASGAATGGAYSFGAGEGGFAERASDVPLGAAVGGAAGAAVPFALRGAQIGINALRGGPAARTAAREAAELGITPSFAMRGTAQGKIAAAGEQFAPTAGRFNADAERVTGEIAGAAERIADTLGPGATPEQGGIALRRGAQSHVNDMRTRTGKLWNEVEKAIPAETRITTPETAAFIRGELEKLADAPNIAASVGNTKLKGWLADMEGAAAPITAKQPKQAGPRKPQTMLQALQSIGVKDPGGDLESIGVRNWDISQRGRKNVIRPDGVDQDIAARMLWERGFFREMEEAGQMLSAEQGLNPEPDLVRAMHRAIDDELVGQPHWAQEDLAEGQAWQQWLDEGRFDQASAPHIDVGDPGAATGEAGLSWQAARSLRTEIGEALGKVDSGTQRDVGTGKLKAIYDRLTKDLDAAAEAAGPEASRAWRKANEHTKATETRIRETFGRILGDKTSPEQAYTTLIGYAMKSGSRANLNNLRRIMRTLPFDDAREVSSTIIRRLGDANPGAQGAEGTTFSAQTFLTNWNKLSDEGRKIIASPGLEDVSGEISKLARVIERANKAGSFRNRSNTGNVTTAAALGAAAIADPVMTGTAIALSHLSARAVTNERFLRALNKLATKGDPAMLARIAEDANNPLAIEAGNMVRAWMDQAKQTPEASPR